MNVSERQQFPTAADMERTEWFKPGNILWIGYWQKFDLVLGFEQNVDGTHEVRVIECDKYGQPVWGAVERRHFTKPGPHDRLVGTVEL